MPVGAQIEQTTQEDISSTKMAATFQQIRAETDSLTVAPAANLEIKAEQPAAYSSASHILLLIDLTSAAVYAPALQVLLSLLKTVSFNASTGRGSARSCIGALGYHGGGTDILKKFNPVCAEDVKAVAELIRKPPPLPKPKSNETSMAAARIGTSFSPLRAALMKSLGMLSPLANKNIKKPSSTQAADEKSVWIITDQQEGTDEIVMACRDGEENGVEYHVLYFGEGDGSWWERIGGLTAIDDEVRPSGRLERSDSKCIVLPSYITNHLSSQAASDPEEVLPALRTLINKARRLSILDLSIPTGGKIRVEVYKLVVKRGRPASVFVDARSNQPVKAVSHHLDMVTGEILPSKSVETYMSLGSSKVKVTPNDIQKIKEKSSGKEAGGVIVGFKPLSTLRPEMRVDTSFHIHPFVSAKRTASKADAINVSAFQALWDGMKRKGVYALARILVRHPGVQRFAALTAVDNGGLTCIWLPFEDDLRIPTPVPEYKANGVQVEAAVGMFEAMDISGIEWGYRSGLERRTAKRQQK